MLTEAVKTHKGQFKNYVLLGDSVASGYRDEVTENDELFNEANQETVYYRVPGSYADVLANGIMSATSDTTFSPDANLTSGQLNAAFNAVNGASASESRIKDATVIELFINVFGSSVKKGFVGFFKGLALSYKILADNDFKATNSITRGEAANYIKVFCEI